MNSFTVGGVEIGTGGLSIIAGPCVIESFEQCLEIGRHCRDAARRLGVGYIFKASFDKANRTSIDSFRGPGLDEGCRILAAVRAELGVPALTDIHTPEQCEQVAEAVDVLQIPAFLARQTDLVVAAGQTGRAVNVKKAQFMAPWDMAQVVRKLEAVGCRQILLTERGTSFGYNTLVVDFRGLPQMQSLAYPVCFDVTHSMQQPGGQGHASGATREYAPHLLRAAVAVGVDALFLEVHPDPDHARSDAAAQLPLTQFEELVARALAIHRIARS